MKRVLILALIVLVGCTNKVDASEIYSYIDVSEDYAEIAGSDREGYINHLKDFNEYLEGIKDNNYSNYVQLQIEANNMRIEALESKNSDLITESSFKQAKALLILESIRESE